MLAAKYAETASNIRLSAMMAMLWMEMDVAANAPSSIHGLALEDPLCRNPLASSTSQKKQ